jgi:hypothetical protein
VNFSHKNWTFQVLSIEKLTFRVPVPYLTA